MADKFDESLRTFESRLLFIRDIFMNKYPNEQIMKNCIEFKLRKSLENYENDLHKKELNLSDADPIKVLKKMK